MGSISDILSMVPGVNNKALKGVNIDEKEFDRVGAIIHSMTNAERENPDIIDSSRRKRIAAGSGTNVNDVNKLLKQFKELRKMMKQFGNIEKQMKKSRFKLPF